MLTLMKALTRCTSQRWTRTILDIRTPHLLEREIGDRLARGSQLLLQHLLILPKLIHQKMRLLDLVFS